MPLSTFHPAVQRWFQTSFNAPSPPQAVGWPLISQGKDVLICAPTGSGKTLTAFMACLDSLFRQAVAGTLEDRPQVVYVSPLKALSNDIEKNLREPLRGIYETAGQMGIIAPEIRVLVRTGDTLQSERAAMIKRPPHILVTTPESLFILLTANKSREFLRGVRTVIIDEIHAVARDKRGAHLALSLERLDALRAAGRTPGVPPGVAPGFEIEGRKLEGEGNGQSSVSRLLPSGTPPADTPHGTPGLRTAPRPQRIGLSATQRPVERVAQFLVGSTRLKADGSPDCTIVNLGHLRKIELEMEIPLSPLQAVCSHETWEEIYERLTTLIKANRTTLIFVNTRRMCERLAAHLSKRLGDDKVTSHHGSLSRIQRLSAEARLKAGSLSALVATASLELGIDIGTVELVCQIGVTHSIGTLLQRVGRSGHSLTGISRGKLFALTLDEAMSGAALCSAVKRGFMDILHIPEKPLDILAQQIVAASAAEEWDENQLYELMRGGYNYRNLTRKEFDEVVSMLAEGFSTRRGRKAALIHYDGVGKRILGRKGARLAAITSGGAIPDTADYQVVQDPQGIVVGTLNEDFAVESTPGDIFQLGNTSWKILKVEPGRVRVEDAHGQPPSIPFWLGEAPSRSDELSEEVTRLRKEIERRLEDTECGRLNAEGGQQKAAEVQRVSEGDSAVRRPGVPPGVSASSEPATDLFDYTPETVTPYKEPARQLDSATTALVATDESPPAVMSGLETAVEYVMNECGIERAAAEQLVVYLADSKRVLGVIPTMDTLVLERFFDEAGGMQLILHAPFGRRVMWAWGLALRKRFCRGFNFELQAAASENALLLSLGPQHSFPLADVFNYLHTNTVEDLLVQAMIVSPVFQTRWRWDASRSLALLRFTGGKKVPPQIQRMRSDDLLAAVFPHAAACPETLEGDIEVPDHPLIREVIGDCLHEAMDIDGVRRVLTQIEKGELRLVARDTVEPSALASEILTAKPYAFLDDAPLEERRTQAVIMRRGTKREDADGIGALDEGAIQRVRDEAWPDPQTADELHDALMLSGYFTDVEVRQFQPLLEQLKKAGRATAVRSPGVPPGVPQSIIWLATERVPLFEAAYASPVFAPVVEVPPKERAKTWTQHTALVEILRGRLEVLGPVTAARLATELQLESTAIDQAIIGLETQGTAMRGHFSRGVTELEWCDRRLLARIHRYTIDRLRNEIEPVAPSDYLRFLFDWQHAIPGKQFEGPQGVREALQQLQGIELSAVAWERDVLPMRVKSYDRKWLDQLSLSGEVLWGRRFPPQSDPEGGRRTGLVRHSPIGLFLREQFDYWLSLAPPLPQEETYLSGAAREVLEQLRRRGAVFFQNLVRETRRLPSDVENALGELVAAGLITCDGFGGLRALLSPPASREKIHRHRRALQARSINLNVAGIGVQKDRMAASMETAGRWSLFRGDQNPDLFGKISEDEIVENVAKQLLRRWGVVFHRVIVRETGLPPWRDILRVYRRMEARGELRGGRFVSGFSGEQYALPEAVDRLRAIRKTAPDGKLITVSGADPLNLAGLITPGDKVAARAKSRIVFRDGVPVAVREAGQVRILERDPAPAVTREIYAALIRKAI
jgi:ATP-dependent helicase Lhr and Lhr-like helicase